ncbi:uncharacterized protein BKCO1_1000388 [Diplodia corticola]|uniref:Uncharacterized protein n=1 Tax=Diplodia corticola TaxID=236234 RepID=A0A1J9RJS3_9PEZI|nr:uncharacterized protein BKCO1_1000388 [Diplodia corticola]OJD40258.1 hypothetical protein BKCO1_1000388 [Diplodia corticola]
MTTGTKVADEASVHGARPEQRYQEDGPSFRRGSTGARTSGYPPPPPLNANLPPTPHQICDRATPRAEETGKTVVANEALAQNVQTERRQKKDCFPFMELPSELRLEIYRMALSRPKPILLHMPRPSEKEQNQGDYQWETEEDGPDLFGRPTRNSETVDVDQDEQDLVLPRRNAPDRRIESRKQLPTGDSGINTDPLVPALLRVSQLIYRESRPVLYSDNELVLHLPSALCTLSQLHQRSRSLIKHVRLAIPTHHDILEGFADLVRLGLRYCWGLKTFTISLPDMFPEERHVPSSTTNVYANAFHILRWLPKNTLVQLEGNVHEEIRKVVEENGQLSKKLNEERIGLKKDKVIGVKAGNFFSHRTEDREQLKSQASRWLEI